MPSRTFEQLWPLAPSTGQLGYSWLIGATEVLATLQCEYLTHFHLFFLAEKGHIQSSVISYPAIVAAGAMSWNAATVSSKSTDEWISCLPRVLDKFIFRCGHIHSSFL